MDNLINNTAKENLPDFPNFLDKEQRIIHQNSSFSRVGLAIDIGSNNIINQSVDPNFLLSLDPYSDKLSKYLNTLSSNSFEQLKKDIENGKVPNKVTSLFKNKINPGSCPGNQKVMLLLDSINKREIIEKRNSIIEEIKEKFNGNEALVIKLIEKLEKSAEEDPCTFDLIRIINDFNENEIKKYNESLKKGEEHIEVLNSGIALSTSGEILELSKTKLKQKKEELKIKLYSLPESDEKKALQEELLLLEQKEKQTNKALVTANNLTEEDAKDIIEMQNENKTNEEIMSYLRKRNKSLDKALTELEKTKKDTTKKEKSEPREEERKNSSSNNDNFYDDNKPEKYGDSYRLPLENGGYIEGLTEEEFTITLKHPEAAENLVEFKQTLDELKLGKIWDYRIHIFKAISSVQFSSTDTDYLDKKEIKKFLNAVIKSITPELKKDGNTDIPTNNIKFENYKNKLKLLSYNKKINISGENYLEQIFIDKFSDTTKGAGYFKHTDFINAIKN